MTAKQHPFQQCLSVCFMQPNAIWHYLPQFHLVVNNMFDPGRDILFPTNVSPQPPTCSSSTFYVLLSKKKKSNCVFPLTNMCLWYSLPVLCVFASSLRRTYFFNKKYSIKTFTLIIFGSFYMMRWNIQTQFLQQLFSQPFY